MTPQEGIARAREQARHLHRRFGVESVAHVDVHAFAARLGVQVVNARLQGAVAQLVVTPRRARILLSDRLEDPFMRRVAIAHELGHYVLDHPSPTIAEMCSPRPDRPCTEARDFESEAHGFALELLTPAPAVEAFCRRYDPDLELCSRLAVTAWVPNEHAAIRIAETSEHICAAVLSTRAGIAWVAPSRRFVAELGGSLAPDLHEARPLDPRSLAWRILDRDKPCEPARVPAEAWLGMPGLPLFEHSAPVALGGGMLTMLWAADLEAALVSSRRQARAMNVTECSSLTPSCP
jgi:Zn-dependent peptidase ImmA (M78 family)